MELFASIFVGRPLNILALAVIFLVGHLVLRFTSLGSRRHPRSLLVASAAWGLYAVWEWLVVIFTPEANIRVDLILIWPVLLIVTIWFAIRAFR